LKFLISEEVYSVFTSANSTPLSQCVSFLCFCIGALLPLCAAIVYSSSTSEIEDYVATQFYDGRYSTSQLYVRPAPLTPWQSGKITVDVTQLQCSDAADRLRTHGLWSGQLSVTGTCDDADTETLIWTTGNYLNYRSKIRATQRQLQASENFDDSSSPAQLTSNSSIR
jgi:hypothetical protein